MARQWTEKVGSDPMHSADPSPTRVRTKPYAFLLTFFLMFFVWIILSGRFDAFHLALGVLSSALVAFFSGDLLFSEQDVRGLAARCVRFMAYLPWLLYQVFLANLHIMYLVFHPKMMELIDPHILRFQSILKDDLSLVTFANSITLTPGTITVYVSMDGAFKVHAIDRKSGEALPGEMEERIARTFGED